MTAIILLTIVVIVFISMARQKFGPDLGMPFLALAGLVLSSPVGAGVALKHGFEVFAHIAVTFTAVAIAAHQLKDSNLLRVFGMFTGTAIGRAAQRVGLPVTWGVSFFCLFTTWALAATLHNTTAILVATPITIIICQQFDVSARPILYASLVASNLGGFSTRWGDTPNLIEAAQWGLQYGDFVQIMAINLGLLLIIIGLVASRLTPVRLKGPELESILYKFDRARNALAINWKLAFSALAGLMMIIVPPVISPESELRFVAIGILCLCFGQRFFSSRAEKHHNPFDALGFETLSTLAAVFVLAAVLGSPEIGITEVLKSWLVSLQAPVWAIALISYIGTLLTEAASWANAAAPMVYGIDPSHRAAWALGAGICAGSSSLVTAASAGILLMKQTEQSPEHAVTFGGYLKFGLFVSFLMLVYYSVVLTLIYRS